MAEQTRITLFMSEYDEIIRQKVADLAQAEASSSQLSAEQAKSLQAETERRAAEKQSNAAAVIEICGKLVVWANDHPEIKQNAPSNIGRGWLLGHREGAPYDSGFTGEFDWSTGSVYSILALPSGELKEAMLKRANTNRLINLLHGKQEVRALISPGDYMMSSVVDSIVQFSYSSGVQWEE